MRETADKVGKYETTIDSYKRKLEELSDLKRQLKILEEKNTNYMQQNLELEEEVKKNGTWKPQVEIYKKQVAELHQKLGEETKRADKFEFEVKKIQEKMLALTREKEHLVVERDCLKETNEELKCIANQASTISMGNTLLGISGGSNETVIEEMLPPEIREKISRLTNENKMLKLQQERFGSERLSIVQALLDDANQQIQTLKSENRMANQKILNLESQVEEVQAERLSERNPDLNVLRKEIVVLQAQNKELAVENENQKQKIEQQEESLEDLSRKCTHLKDSISRKDGEITNLEERYRKCIEKAKVVVSGLGSTDPKQASEMTTLKNQLFEKTNLIEKLQERLQKDDDIKSEDFNAEYKFLVSYFYRMVSNLIEFFYL